MANKSKSKAKAKANNGPATQASAAGQAARNVPGTATSAAAEKPKKQTQPLKPGPDQKNNKKTGGRRRKARNMADNQAPQLDQVVDKYDMELSKKRLETEGFHPAVTSKTPAELLVIGGREMKKHWARPSREHFRNGAGGFQGIPVSQSRSLTRALLVFRRDFMRGRFEEQAQDAGAENNLARFVDAIDIGGQISELIFADGYRTVHNVALTSTQSWTALANSTKLWDFFAGDFFTDGPARVFIAVAPEYTIGEFQYAETYDPCGLEPANPLSSWFSEATKAETEIYVSIVQLHRLLSRRHKPKPKLGPLTDEIVKRTNQLADVKHIHGSNQFRSSPPCQVFDASAYFALTRLQRMMKKVFEQRAGLKLLYFQKTPFLDRRMLAIMLRACPRVEMVGIYDCPLIHFGDVVCLLDLIHEINKKRRKDGLPLIKALDFFPRYHEGMPFDHPWAETYGLSWGPQSLDIVQRGFFYIVLKAFMKARAMKLDLLFAKGKAFREFLFKVPNYTLAVPSFLDALYRYADWQRKKGSENGRNKIVYDIVKPVRLGLEETGHEWPRWYNEIMGRHLVFCASCGYETLEEFFTAQARDSPPHARVCAGCLLQRRLDTEDDHLKRHKKRILDCLCPEWDGLAFNEDAPLGAAARRLVRLESSESVRPERPPLTLNDQGYAYAPQYEEPLVRDCKIHWDSLQQLPSLGELVEKAEFAKKWADAINGCNQMDMYSRLLRRLRVEEDEAQGGSQDGSPGGSQGGNQAVAKKVNRLDGGMTDHIEERQPPRAPDQLLSRSFRSVVELETYVYDQGWL